MAWKGTLNINNKIQSTLLSFEDSGLGKGQKKGRDGLRASTMKRETLLGDATI